MDDPYGLLPVGFDVDAALVQLDNWVNPPLKFDPPVGSFEEPVEKPSAPEYDWRSHLDSHLKKGRKQGAIDEPVCMTIRCCFVELMRLFRENYNRKNFLSYGFFINRILEMHGLYGSIYAKEPKTKYALNQNWRLWRIYEDWIETQIVVAAVSSKILWRKYREWQSST